MCCFSSCFSLKDIGSGYRRKKTTIYTLNRLTIITRSDGSVISYGYDKRNQLIRENDPRTGKTIVYTYDAGGNLTTQKEYAYTTAATLSAAPTKTITASYSTAWKDQLLNWDGAAMTYDGS